MNDGKARVSTCPTCEKFGFPRPIRKSWAKAWVDLATQPGTLKYLCPVCYDLEKLNKNLPITRGISEL